MLTARYRGWGLQSSQNESGLGQLQAVAATRSFTLRSFFFLHFIFHCTRSRLALSTLRPGTALIISSGETCAKSLQRAPEACEAALSSGTQECVPDVQAKHDMHLRSHPAPQPPSKQAQPAPTLELHHLIVRQP